MANEEYIRSIQKLLQESEIPGWLFYDFRELDPIAVSILRFEENYHATRRWFYLIPARGEPQKLVHRIESEILDHLPGDKSIYLRWDEFRSGLKRLLEGFPALAMQVSSIPYVSRVDAGTIDTIRGLGTEVLSSENLVQVFQATWTESQLRQHRRAGQELTTDVREAFQLVAESLRQGRSITEFDVQDYIMECFKEHGYITDSPPIVGANANAANPHYTPTETEHSPIAKGDFLLIDLWARETDPEAVFADITWTAYFGAQAPEEVRKVFDVVTRSRDRGFELLDEHHKAGRATQGWEVDDAVRKVIDEGGYGDYFVHRTGHNLGRESPHGNGVNFDNLETRDTREVIRGIGCTIEPGVYLADFGVRSEINIYMGQDGPEITTPPQKELLVFDV